MVMRTDDPVLRNNTRELPAIMCAQRRARKCVPEEKDMIQANIDSFGDDIGKTTNHITAMYDVIAQYPVGSREYETLNYRIMSGQLYQQNAMDCALSGLSQ